MATCTVSFKSTQFFLQRGVWLCLMLLIQTGCAAAVEKSEPYLFHDAHFHLTNYVQQGTDIYDYIDMMGDTIGRSTLFGIPLQQQWSYESSGDFAPTYYLHTDAPLYYYSFTDAYIAMAYKSLPPEHQARLDPMITGFNPADMYATEHIKRVLKTFPGVFTGIGEFSIHKEFVSSKIAGGPANLKNPALDRILQLAGEIGLVVILHNDIDMPFPKPGQEPYLLARMKDLFMRHQDTTIIWAHAGLGRIVRPVEGQLDILDKLLADPNFKNIYIDISWDETAKYVVASDQSIKGTASLIKRYPDRFLFGTDVVAPKSRDAMLDVYKIYTPLWEALGKDVTDKVLKKNYERIFDAARANVRTWEKANIK